jgi:hypothetical protein
MVIRCPSCGKPFTYRPPADLALSLDAKQEASLPGQPRQKSNGGLSVFAQTELVEQVSEASAVQATAESQKGEKQSRSLGVGAVGALVVLGFVLYLMYRPQNAPGPREASARYGLPPQSKVRDAPRSEKKAWEDAIEEALKPGLTPSPHTDEMRLSFWKTGQVLSAQGSRKVSADEGWGILKTDQPGYGSRQALYVRLHRKVSLEVLRLISKDILSRASPGYELSFVHFYTPWALDKLKRDSTERLDLSKAKWWASSRFEFKPESILDVSIYGLTVEDEEILTALPFPADVKVLGSWLCDSSRDRWAIYRDSNDQLHVEGVGPGSAKPEIAEELIELPSSAGRRFEGKGPDSDESISYYFIEEEGDLQIHFKDGIIYKAQAIR